MDMDGFESIRKYVGFDERSAALLADFHPVAAPHFTRIIDDFYDTIEAHPEAAAVISGGRAQVQRLKVTLTAWLGSILLGPHDAEFLDSHSRIGRVHVRINLPQQFMFTAMNRIRAQLLDVAAVAYSADSTKHGAMRRAINQILDLELAIMLDTYREDLTEKMRLRERLAILGQIAATIAHELRNPLGTVQSSLYLLRRRTEKLDLDDAVLNKHYDKISQEIDRCGETIHNLLDLVRERAINRQPILVSDLFTMAIDASGLPRHVQVVVDAVEGLSVWGDRDQLRQMLANLLQNAADAMNGRGRILLQARRMSGGTELSVEDEGPGVPHDIRRKIFDVLFTTKASGTGLGLALVQRIVETHEGSVALIPSPQGARFRVWLPEQPSC